MSLSLTELSWQHKTKMPEIALDIMIKTRECLAVLSRPNERRIIWEKRWSVPEDLRHGCFDETDYSWLETITRDIDQLVGTSIPKINVILPDPIFKHVTMLIEDPPKKQEELERLIRWRLSVEFYINPEDMAVDYQVNSGTESVFSVFCIKNHIMDNIENYFRAHNLFVAAYYPESAYLLRQQITEVDKVCFAMQSEDYLTYGICSGSKNIHLFQSDFIEAKNHDVLREVYMRARREFLSSALTGSNKSNECVLLLMGVVDQEYRNIFNDFSVNVISKMINLEDRND